MNALLETYFGEGFKRAIPAHSSIRCCIISAHHNHQRGAKIKCPPLDWCGLICRGGVWGSKGVQPGRRQSGKSGQSSA
ncbi:unnamed protein product [Plasmodium vivax]|uniref:(malaria parasite P. vivax) hypothetical protein n=1 Tax=Plasmodium vivax TaxID=5855 RepID=A0A8S4HHQ2_PLAVI|nr:unnamed protein product [Plasmodium vivax]CAI7720255.1 hypothetical protein PVPAM_080047800 [Plasmodium vivax]